MQYLTAAHSQVNGVCPAHAQSTGQTRRLYSVLFVACFKFSFHVNPVVSHSFFKV